MHSDQPDRDAGATPRPRIIYLVNQLNLLVRRMLDDRLKPHELGGLHYTILSLVRDRAGISSAELSRRFFVTPQTMSESVTALERRGLIERRESASNKRILNTFVTPAGLDLLQACDAIADQVERDAFGSLAPEDRHALRDLLRRQLHHVQGMAGN